MHDHMEVILPPTTEDVEAAIWSAMVSLKNHEYYSIGGRWHGCKYPERSKQDISENDEEWIKANTATVGQCLSLKAYSVMIVFEGEPVFLIHKEINNGISYNTIKWDQTIKGAVDEYTTELERELESIKYINKIDENDEFYIKRKAEIAKHWPSNDWLAVTVDYKH